jgi:hypothetical protein
MKSFMILTLLNDGSRNTSENRFINIYLLPIFDVDSFDGLKIQVLNKVFSIGSVQEGKLIAGNIDVFQLLEIRLF